MKKFLQGPIYQKSTCTGNHLIYMLSIQYCARKELFFLIKKKAKKRITKQYNHRIRKVHYYALHTSGHKENNRYTISNPPITNVILRLEKLNGCILEFEMTNLLNEREIIWLKFLLASYSFLAAFKYTLLITITTNSNNSNSCNNWLNKITISY